MDTGCCLAMLDLHLDAWRFSSQGITVRHDIHSAIFSFWGYEWGVVSHTAQQRGDKILELVGIL